MAKRTSVENSIITGVIYARYSSHSQKEESIEQQIEECTAFAVTGGISVVGIYADKAISGRTDRRNEFQRLMRDAEKRKFDVVIAYKSNRISRNMLNALQYESRLDSFGIKTLYAKEEFGNTAAGRFALRTMMNVNQFYSENMAEDIRRGLKDNAAECKVNGSLPYGYKKGEDGKYAIDEPRAAIVREIFSKVVDDVPYADIIRSLNDRGILTKTRKPFNKNSFNRMLRNERYIGIYEHSGVRVVGGVPAIISEEVFYAVQRKLQEGLNSEGAKRKSNSDYLLTGKLYCGECGSPMVGYAGTSRNGTLHYYYTCKSRGNDGCTKHNVRRDFIEQFVVDLTRACLSRADVTDWLVSGYIELKKQAQETSDVPVMEEELSSRKKALDNIMKAIEAGIFNETTSARMQELETEIHDLERSIALGKAMFEEPVDGERMRFYLEKLRNGTPDNQAYRKELLRTMVKAIRLWDDRIEIEYNFTGTDGDGNNYRVVTEFLKGDSGSASGVHTEPPQPHQRNSTPVWVCCFFIFLSLYLRQGGGSDGLPNAAEALVRELYRYYIRKLGILIREHRFAGGYDNIPSPAAHHTPKEQYIIIVIIIVVQRKRVRKIRPYAAIDRGGFGIALLRKTLYRFQSFCIWHIRGKFNTGKSRKLCDRILREILHAAADIARPLVPHSAGRRVHRHKRKLIEPAGHATVFVNIADGLARPHRYAEEVIFV